MRAEFEGKLRTARNKDPAFVIDGYCNWKKALERFREHQTSACHLLAIDSIVTLPKTGADIGSSLSDVYKTVVAKTRQILRKIFEYVQFLARQGIAFQGDTDEDSNSEPMMMPVCRLTEKT